MRYYFGRKSKERLETVDRRLSYILNKTLKSGLIDVSVLQGERYEDEQNDLFEKGLSKLKFPESKHNSKPSLAIDAAPYLNGKVSYNYNHCCFLAGIILGTAKQFGYEIRWGGNWDMDGEPITDQDFQDLLHYELVT